MPLVLFYGKRTLEEEEGALCKAFEIAGTPEPG